MVHVIRGGHTKASTGANGILNELDENRKIYPEVIKLLSQFNEVHDATPDESVPYPYELSYGIRLANNVNADLFASIHFNKCYDTFDGALGAEICVFNENGEAARKGRIILDRLSRLGFKNRGIKVRNDLGELNSTNCEAMIIEVCFVEAAGDVNVYNTLGVSRIASAIASGLDERVSFEPMKVDDVTSTYSEVQPIIEYASHIQNKGWMPYVKDGETCGSTGEGLRLEALTVRYFGEGYLDFQVHIQNLGWTEVRRNGEIAGTMGIGLRVEAIIFNLKNTSKKIKYRVHVENIGWMPWVYNGEVAGTTGRGLKIEAIEIVAE